MAETRTTRADHRARLRAAGHRPRLLAAGRTTLRALGLVKPAMREYLHTLYQFTDPWVVDDANFRTAFGASPPRSTRPSTPPSRGTATARPVPLPEGDQHMSTPGASPGAGATDPERRSPRGAPPSLWPPSSPSPGSPSSARSSQYPQILEEPTADILALFRAHQGAVVTWFLVLVVSAALMAPAGIWLGRLAGGTLGRWIAGVGIAAATVQVIGLQRWVTLVPGISDDALDPARRADAEDRFELLHTLLGKVIGETLGYALTATFTVLVVDRPAPHGAAALAGRGRLRRSGRLIATGVVIPLVEAASLTNFAGYVAWCAWLLAVAVLLFRAPAEA